METNTLQTFISAALFLKLFCKRREISSPGILFHNISLSFVYVSGQSGYYQEKKSECFFGPDLLDSDKAGLCLIKQSLIKQVNNNWKTTTGKQEQQLEAIRKHLYYLQYFIL